MSMGSSQPSEEEAGTLQFTCPYPSCKRILKVRNIDEDCFPSHAGSE
ncbi:7319_t:CDS:1, partial [Paraglomus brasilianum]